MNVTNSLKTQYSIQHLFANVKEFLSEITVNCTIKPGYIIEREFALVDGLFQSGINSKKKDDFFCSKHIVLII